MPNKKYRARHTQQKRSNITLNELELAKTYPHILESVLQKYYNTTAEIHIIDDTPTSLGASLIESASLLFNSVVVQKIVSRSEANKILEKIRKSLN